MAGPLQDMLANLRQRRQRRQRGNDLVNPMDSAATMDRLQGAELDDFSTVVAAPQMATASLAGGGSSPIRATAGSRVAATTVGQRGPCKDGKCATGGSAMSLPTYQMPMATTVTQPATASPRTPIAGTGIEFAQRSVDLGDSATGMVNVSPAVSGHMGTQSLAALEFADSQLQREHERRNDADNNRRADRAAEITAASAAAEAAKNYADADLSRATSDLIGQKVGPRRMENSQKMLASVAEGKATPMQYADAMTAMDIGLNGENAQVPSLAGPQLQENHERYKREAMAALAINFVITGDSFYQQSRRAFSDMGGAPMVGTDPETGRPIETRAVFSPNKSLDRAVTTIASAYNEAEMMGGDWGQIDAALHNDVLAPMRSYMMGKYESMHEDFFRSLPRDAQDAARAEARRKGDELANKWFDYVRKEMSLRNRAIGGGGIDNEKGDNSWWSNRSKPWGDPVLPQAQRQSPAPAAAPAPSTNDRTE